MLKSMFYENRNRTSRFLKQDICKLMNILLLHSFVYVVPQRHLMVFMNYCVITVITCVLKGQMAQTWPVG